jgi:hypothetical protein
MEQFQADKDIQYKCKYKFGSDIAEVHYIEQSKAI